MLITKQSPIGFFKKSLSSLLRDLFANDKSSPLLTTRNADPGPGTLISDASLVSALSISSQTLHYDGSATGKTAFFKNNSGSEFSSNAGSVWYFSFKGSNYASALGSFGISSSGNLITGIKIANDNLLSYFDSTSANRFNPNTWYQLAIAVTDLGVHGWILGGQYAIPTLFFTRKMTTSVSMALEILTNSNAFDFRRALMQKPGNSIFSTYASLASYTYSSLALNGTFSHPAKFIFEADFTVPTGAHTRIAFRRIDANNEYALRLQSTGQAVLQLLKNGTAQNYISTATGLFTGSGTIYIVVNGPNWDIYWDQSGTRTNVLSYNGAYGYLGEVNRTGGYIELVSSGGSLSNIKIYDLEAVPAKSFDLQPRFAVNVIDFGGSITNGTASTDHESQSWRALTAKNLNSNAVQSNVYANVINAGVGGTGSDLGMCRVARDILSLSNVKCVFFDHSVNDYNTGYVLASDILWKNCKETEIRTILAASPTTQLVLLSFIHSSSTDVGSGGMLDDWAAYEAAGGTGDLASDITNNPTAFAAAPYTVASNAALANHYGLLHIDASYYFYGLLKAGTYVWSDLQNDAVHPTDLGHSLIGAYINSHLNGAVLYEDGPAIDVSGIAPLYSPYSNSKLVEAWDSSITASGTWVKRTVRFLSSVNFGDYYVSNTTNDTLTYSWNGSFVGVWLLDDTDCGIISWAIDGGSTTTIDTYETSENQNYHTLTSTLTPGNHTIVFKVTGTKNSSSSDTKLKIYAITSA